MEFTNDVPTGISSFQAPTDTVGFAVGSGGLILKYEGDTITNQTEEDEITKLTNFILFQNYPNPFNPVTTMKYDVPKPGNIELIIYDILGRKVTTLINEQKPPGRYEAVWDASNATSSIYIYQLRAGDYVDTKKMILLK